MLIVVCRIRQILHLQIWGEKKKGLFFWGSSISTQNGESIAFFFHISRASSCVFCLFAVIFHPSNEHFVPMHPAYPIMSLCVSVGKDRRKERRKVGWQVRRQRRQGQSKGRRHEEGSRFQVYESRSSGGSLHLTPCLKHTCHELELV